MASKDPFNSRILRLIWLTGCADISCIIIAVSELRTQHISPRTRAICNDNFDPGSISPKICPQINKDSVSTRRTEKKESSRNKQGRRHKSGQDR